jgi:hypothetical protein
MTEMDINNRFTQIEKKIDTLLSILGHGRDRSHAEIERMAAADFQRIMIETEQRKKRKAMKGRKDVRDIAQPA